MSHRNLTEETFQPPAPFQRVRYAFGMVMGVDEFEQEQAYFLAKYRLHNAVLHGFGTVAGLQVIRDGTQIVVMPGTALDPLGRLIQVYPAQSADLTEWLQEERNRQSLRPRYPEPGYSLYVTLAYAEAQTDYAPLPGAHHADSPIASSRVTESFRLALTPTPPVDPGAEQVRRLSDLLSRLRPSHTGGVSEAEMAEWVRALRRQDDILPPGRYLPVRPDTARHVLETALRVWVTEVRSLPTQQALINEKEQPAVLLARIDFALGAGGEVSHLGVAEEGRPCVLPSRLLEEHLARLTFPGPGGESHPYPPSPVQPAPVQPAPVQPPVQVPPPVLAPIPAPAPAPVYPAPGQTPGYRVVAAGEVTPDGQARGFNLQARYAGNGCYRINFAGYRPGGIYVVKGTPVVRMGDRSPTFEVLHTTADNAILVRVGDTTAGFMIEISQVD